MKLERLLPLPLVALTLLLTSCEEHEERGFIVLNPSVAERPFFHDFGTLRHGARTEHTVLLENTDREAVTIRSANGACACTMVKAVRLMPPGGGEPIEEGDLDDRKEILVVPPGGQIEFVVGLTTASIQPNHDKLAILRMVTSSKNTPWVTFEMHVRAERLFIATPGEIRMGEIPTGYGGSSKTKLMTGMPGSEARLLEVVETTGDVTAELDYVYTNGEHLWGVTATFPPNLPFGPKHETITLSATDASGEGDASRIEIEVWATVVEDIAVLPRRLHFGALPLGKGGVLDASLRALVPGARVKVLEAEVGGPAGEHVLVSFEPDGYVDSDGRAEKWAVVLTADDGLAKGIFEGTLRLALDDEQTPEVQVEFQGYVR